MPECKADDRLFKRNYTLKKLKQMLCKLENKNYEKDNHIEPTVLIRGERCECKQPKEPVGETSIRSNLDGGEAFPFVRANQTNVRWCPKYPCLNEDLNKEMGCYKAAQVCKECDMCCECEVAEGSHLHLPKVRDCSKPLKSQCYASDFCTDSKREESRSYEPDCDPNLYPNRWFPNISASCQYPKPCPASCLDHAELNDWAIIIISIMLQTSTEAPSLLFSVVHQHLPLNDFSDEPLILEFKPVDFGLETDDIFRMFQLILIFQIPYQPDTVNFNNLTNALENYTFPPNVPELLTNIIRIVQSIDFSVMPLAPRVLMIQSSNLSSIAIDTMTTLLTSVNTPSPLMDLMVEIMPLLGAFDVTSLSSEPSVVYIIQSSNFFNCPAEYLQQIVASLASLDGSNLLSLMLQVLTRIESKPSVDQSDNDGKDSQK